MTGSWLAALPLARLAAGSSGQGLPVWVAGLSAVGGAAVTLLVQIVSGHNSNRRADGMLCGEFVADFLAAAQAIVRALPAGDGPVPGRHPGQAAARRLDTCYARAILILPVLQEQLAPARARVTAFAAGGPRDAAARRSLAEDLDTLINEVRPHLRIPIRGLGI